MGDMANVPPADTPGTVVVGPGSHGASDGRPIHETTHTVGGKDGGGLLSKLRPQKSTENIKTTLPPGTTHSNVPSTINTTKTSRPPVVPGTGSIPLVQGDKDTTFADTVHPISGGHGSEADPAGHVDVVTHDDKTHHNKLKKPQHGSAGDNIVISTLR